MTLYKIILFLHVTGALLLSAAISLEWLCIANIRKPDAIARVEESVLNYSRLRKVGDIAAFLILFPGIYMMVAVWDNAPWGISGFFGLVLIGMIGGITTGKKMKKISKIIRTENKNLPELATLIKDNSLWFSIKLRTAILVGVIFLMTVKPQWAGSIITMITSIILGALPLRMKRHLPVAGATETTKDD